MWQNDLMLYPDIPDQTWRTTGTPAEGLLNILRFLLVGGGAGSGAPSCYATHRVYVEIKPFNPSANVLNIQAAYTVLWILEQATAL